MMMDRSSDVKSLTRDHNYSILQMWYFVFCLLVGGGDRATVCRLVLLPVFTARLHKYFPPAHFTILHLFTDFTPQGHKDPLCSASVLEVTS